MKVYVPLNQSGIEELNLLFEVETDNLKIYEFSPDDYFYLENNKYFDFLNVECDCVIDLFEEEDIQNDKLNNAIEITNILINQSTDDRFIDLLTKFVQIFELAISSNTFVNIFCYGDSNFING